MGRLPEGPGHGHLEHESSSGQEAMRTKDVEGVAPDFFQKT